MGRCTQIYFDAAEAIAKMKIGTEIPHSVMSSLVKTSPISGAYHSRIGEVKEILKADYKIFLRSNPKHGYEIVKPENSIVECENQFLQGYRWMVRGVSNTQYIDIDAINDAEAKTKTIEKAQKMASLAGFIRNGLTMLDAPPQEPKTLKDIAKSVGMVKEKPLPGIGDAMKICRKRSPTMTSRN